MLFLFFPFRVLESETYIFNMAEANSAGETTEPEWYKLYTATQVIYTIKLTNFGRATQIETP